MHVLLYDIFYIYIYINNQHMQVVTALERIMFYVL